MLTLREDSIDDSEAALAELADDFVLVKSLLRRYADVESAIKRGLRSDKLELVNHSRTFFHYN